MLNADWYVHPTRTNDDLFVFQSAEDDEVQIPKSWTTDEQIARGIATEIYHQRQSWFRKGIECGRIHMASDLRNLLNAAPMELE